MSPLKIDKMTLIRSLFIIQFCVLGLVKCQGKPEVPKINGSYRTMGEIVFKSPNIPGAEQMYLEENYDKNRGRSSFFYSIDGGNATIFEDLNRNQVWVLTYKDGSGQPECIELKEADIEKQDLPWRIFQLKGMHEILPIRQILNLEDKYVTKWGDNKAYRGIAAKNYEYVIDTKENETPVRYEIKSSWSDGTQTSPSKLNTVPLGFQIDKIVHVEGVLPLVTVRNINLFGFTHDDVNENVFLPLRGVFCPGIKDEAPFPDFAGLKSISFNAEFMLNQNASSRNYIDFWLDVERKLVQVDEHIREDSSTGRLSTDFRRIFTSEQGAFYGYPLEDISKSETEVGDLKSLSLRPEYIIDHRNPNSYSIEGFFGTDKYQYVKTGTSVERGITCTVFQTVRKDWPTSEDSPTTVWEWCIADAENVSFPVNGIPLVSLRIRVVKLNKTSDIDWLFEGSKLSFHFYNVRKPDIAYLDAMEFDISPCFSDNHQTLLQFNVTLKPNIRRAITNETSNFHFAREWKSAIIKATVLQPTSLRVTSVRTNVPRLGSDMIVTFKLLERHPKLPRDIRVKEEELELVKDRLHKALDQGKVKINWTIGKKNISLQATPGTLRLQVAVKATPNATISSPYFNDVEKLHLLKRRDIYLRNYDVVKEEQLKQPQNTIVQKDMIIYLSVALFVGLVSGMIVTYFLRHKYEKV